MKKFRFKIWIIIAAIIIVVSGIIITVYAVNNYEQQSILAEQQLVEQQENQIKTFFQENKEKLNQIKDALWEDRYSVKEIRSDGFIVFKDESDVWMPDISPIIKEIYEKGKECNIRNMDCGARQQEYFWLEAFFPETNMEMNIVFSVADLTIYDNMYSHLEDDWYLFVAGMV